jgi:hypothetical protein
VGLSLILLSYLFAVSSIAQDISLPSMDKVQLFLLVGQSNMPGRGVVAELNLTPHSRVFVLGKDGRWVSAIDPIHFDKPEAGVGQGKFFRQIIADANPGVIIGLIPCAVGGAPVNVWQPCVFYPSTKIHPWDETMKRVGSR